MSAGRARGRALPIQSASRLVEHPAGVRRFGQGRDWHPTPLAARGQTGTVPVFTAIRSAKEEPSFIPAASPRLPRSTSRWPPGRHLETRPGVPRPQWGADARRSRPLSARFEPVDRLRDVMTLVPRVHLSAMLTGPTPSGSAGVPALSGLLPPSTALPGSGCPQLHRPAATGRRRRSLTSTRINSASRRNPKSPARALRPAASASLRDGAPRHSGL